MLVDAGYADDDRDPRRIMAAIHDAGVTQIDTLLVTHFHADHVGGVPSIAAQIPVRRFLDDGDIVRTPAAMADRDFALTSARYAAYLKARDDVPHDEPRPGARLSVGAANVTFVSHAGSTITKPLMGGGDANAACPATAPEAQDRIENPRSNGFLLQFGRFRFLDIGDLSGAPLFALVCPRALLPPIDVYLVPHHGGMDVSYPATFAGFRPRVAIVNNGAVKGGSPDVFAAIRPSRVLEGAWQLHASRNADVENLPAGQIVNLDETTSHWVVVHARTDGTFDVTNARTGMTTPFGASR
jgi:beta-lactamase superfamily II metal-dependent hydrolase